MGLVESYESMDFKEAIGKEEASAHPSQVLGLAVENSCEDTLHKSNGDGECTYEPAKAKTMKAKDIYQCLEKVFRNLNKHNPISMYSDMHFKVQFGLRARLSH